MTEVFAHRGVHARLERENTLGAFRAARRRSGSTASNSTYGAAGDGVLVVHHDPTIAGRADRRTRPSPIFRDYVPRLAEAMDRAARAARQRRDQELARPRRDRLRRERAPSCARTLEFSHDASWMTRSSVSCFDLATCEPFARYDPTIGGRLARRTRDRCASRFEVPHDLGFDAVNPHFSMRRTTRIGHALASSGSTVNVWTVNRRERPVGDGSRSTWRASSPTTRARRSIFTAVTFLTTCGPRDGLDYVP